jgi:hypothetical protein
MKAEKKKQRVTKAEKLIARDVGRALGRMAGAMLKGMLKQMPLGLHKAFYDGYTAAFERGLKGGSLQ